MHVEFKISDVSLTHKTHILDSLDFHPQVWLLFLNDTCFRYVDYVILLKPMVMFYVFHVFLVQILNYCIYNTCFCLFLWSFAALHFDTVFEVLFHLDSSTRIEVPV